MPEKKSGKSVNGACAGGPQAAARFMKESRPSTEGVKPRGMQKDVPRLLPGDVCFFLDCQGRRFSGFVRSPLTRTSK